MTSSGFQIIVVTISLVAIIKCSAGIVPIRDFKNKLPTSSGIHKLSKNMDSRIFKTSKNLTENPQTDETLNQIAKDLVMAILSKLEIQDKITRITQEALEAPGKNKVSAIETRRILDYISRTLSGHILTATKASTEPELHRLVYGLSQIAAEVSIVAALKDITYASELSKKQSVDPSLRKKRETTEVKNSSAPVSVSVPAEVSLLLNKSLLAKTVPLTTFYRDRKELKNSPYAILSTQEKNPIHVLNSLQYSQGPSKGFLNKTVLDLENTVAENNNSIVLQKSINESHIVATDSLSQDGQIINTASSLDDTANQNDGSHMEVSDIENERPYILEDDAVNEIKAKQKLEKLEVKAKKAILYVGDVAYLAAASVIAMRRSLTASIEVQMSVKYAKTGMANHRELMMNLAKTAAQQAGKEAKSAASKALACERVIKLALKYTAQSNGANLNHVANRIVMDSLSLATLAKSMAFVSSEIAINSLYEAIEVKSPENLKDLE